MQIIKKRQLAQSQWLYPNFNFEENNEPLQPVQPTTGTLFKYSIWLNLSEPEKSTVKGLVLQPDDDIDLHSEGLKNIDVIGIYFPNFTEGRGYTQAAILRNQLGYQGELRAINVYRDNLVLLEEVGFDAFDLHSSEDITQALLAFNELDLARHS